MVPERHLTRVQGFVQAIQGGALIITAPLGALLVAALPMAAVMAVDVATAIFAIVPLVFIAVPQPEQNASGSERPGLRAVFGDVLSGVRYLRARRGHTPLVVMAMLVNLCMVPAFALLPLLIVEQGGGATRLGLMNSAFGIGTIVGGVVLGVWGGFQRRVHTVFVGLLVAGVSTLLLGTASATGAAFAGILILGVMIPCINGPIQAVLQATVAPEFQGRVFTLYMSGCAAMAPLGLAIAAPVAELVGVRALYVAGGLACLAMGGGGFLVPSIASIEDGVVESDRTEPAMAA